MGTVAEIQSAIGHLTPQEVEALVTWLDEYRRMIRASAEVFSLYDVAEGKPEHSEPDRAKFGRGPGGIPSENCPPAMNSLELAVATLRSLPEALQIQAVDFIHRLHAANRQERLVALRKTAGCLTDDEADAMERAIAQAYEHADGQQ